MAGTGGARGRLCKAWPGEARAGPLLTGCIWGEAESDDSHESESFLARSSPGRNQVRVAASESRDEETAWWGGQRDWDLRCKIKSAGVGESPGRKIRVARENSQITRNHGAQLARIPGRRPKMARCAVP